LARNASRRTGPRADRAKNGLAVPVEPGQLPLCTSADGSFGPEERDPFFQSVIAALTDSGIPYMVGGAYALERYTGIVRRTKDLDIFVKREDCSSVLAVLARRGYGTELTDSRWIAKAFCGDDFIDIIFNSGNGVCPVDDEWLAHAPDDLVLGMPARLCPLEEIIWQKIFIMERERFDGADVAHLLHARGATLDWERLVRRVGKYWEVLLAHVILFRFIYPGDRDAVPESVREALLDRAAKANRPRGVRDLCRGTLLSRYQYVVDVEDWGYHDARLDAVPAEAA
jgi:hypothetical protein